MHEPGAPRRGLLAYAAIIHEARRGLNELMAACAEGWDAVTAGRQTSGIDATITVLTTLTAALLMGATGGGALPVFATVLTGLGDVGGKTVVALAGDNHAAVADAYLQASGKLVADAALAITNNVFPELRTALTLAPTAPKPPPGMTDDEKFHPRSRPADNLTGTANPTAAIGRRLNPT